MGRQLAFSVAVLDEAGEPVWFAPGVDVPAWAAKLITNPSAWAEVGADDGEDTPAKAPSPRARTAAKE